MVGFALLSALCGPAVEIVLGGEFAGAVPVMLILVPGTLVSTAAIVYGMLPLAVGRTLPNMASALTGLIVSVTVLFILIPHHGAVGAAWARTASLTVSVLVLVPFVISTIRRSHRI